VALPWSVLDCAAYVALSHPAKALLLEFARQLVRDNNGRLIASFAHLAPRGWNSKDVITRAKRELLASGFIFETAVGRRPNRAAWYAVTWRTLDRHPGYDEGMAELFVRGAYRKIGVLSPSHGPQNALIGPAGGRIGSAIGPSPGPVIPVSVLSLAREAGTI
jgi:hypothetical protein